MKNKYTRFCLIYLQNKHKTHGKHSSHSSRHVNNDMCAPPPLLPQNNASCTVLVIWRVKRLAATFRRLSVCRIFLTSTFVMKLKSVNFALHSKCTVHTDYNFYFF